jgi:hypothetical protein
MTEQRAPYGLPRDVTPAMADSLANPTTSSWLKTALLDATDRPPREALADARRLLRLLEEWAGAHV